MLSRSCQFFQLLVTLTFIFVLTKVSAGVNDPDSNKIKAMEECAANANIDKVYGYGVRRRAECISFIRQYKRHLLNKNKLYEALLAEYRIFPKNWSVNPGRYSISYAAKILFELGGDLEEIFSATLDGCEFYSCDDAIGVYLDHSKGRRILKDEHVEQLVKALARRLLYTKKLKGSRKRGSDNYHLYELLSYSLKKRWNPEKISAAWSILRDEAIDESAVEALITLHVFANIRHEEYNISSKKEMSMGDNMLTVSNFLKSLAKIKDDDAISRIIPFAINLAYHHGEISSSTLNSDIVFLFRTDKEKKIFIEKSLFKFKPKFSDPNMANIFLNSINSLKNYEKKMLRRILSNFLSHGVYKPSRESIKILKTLTSDNDDRIRYYAWLSLEKVGYEYPLFDRIGNKFSRTKGMIELYNYIYVITFVLSLFLLVALTRKDKASTSKHVTIYLTFFGINFIVMTIIIVISSLASIGHNSANYRGFLGVWEIGLIAFILVNFAIHSRLCSSFKN